MGEPENPAGSLGVTKQRRVENDLKRANALWSTVFNSTSDLISVINVADFTITEVNRAFVEAYGIPRKEVIGRTCYQITHHCAEPCSGPGDTCPLIETVRSGQHRTTEHLHHDIEGNEIFAEVSASPIRNEKGDIVQVVHISRDVTNRRKAEKELRAREEDLRLTRRMEVLKDEFIGMVSHELKNPLTVIIGALNVAVDDNITPEEAKQLITDAAESAQNLAAMVDNLLELTRHKSNRLNLQTSRAQLEPVVQAVVRKLQNKSAIHRLKVNVPGNLPEVMIDASRMERVLHNLVENAIKYSPKGGEVVIYGRRQGSEVIIGVSDQGIGISPEDVGRLFHSFERLDVSHRFAVSGVGLGLTVCRILVEAHGGRIWAESEPGKGSTFYLALPVVDGG